ncbi:hypothetical protein Hypma_001168 [Hypsizygus marmoreus]|uniref:Uncharacterized protein n=1 Tax=Hypsizygus marmoreus TaxID=39966 RepID=A0A369JFB6_HYPMA|nr:hypothetical protein Hypma_001168 [Hypsizygus marmoreus]
MNAHDFRTDSTIQRWWFEDAFDNRYTDLTIEERVYFLLPCSKNPIHLTAARNTLVAALHDLEDTMIFYGRDDLRWVIVLANLSWHNSQCTYHFPRSSYHATEDDPARRWTARGFDENNVSVATVHCYSTLPAKWYCNGGKRWQGRTLDFDTRCIRL